MDYDSKKVSNTLEHVQGLSDKVSEISWYHRIYIPGFGLTPGSVSKDHQDWIAENLPSSLNGKSVLDIGGWDGFYSFLSEERGASRVLMIDELQNSDAHRTGTRGFDLAKQIRKSAVDFKVLSAYDLEKIDEKFDVILLLGVYYHLLNPFDVLTKINTHLNNGGTLYMEGLYLRGKNAFIRLFERWDIEPTTYCGASVSGLIKILERSGFTNIKVLSKKNRYIRIIAYLYKIAQKHHILNHRVVNVGRSIGLHSYPRIIISANK